jgi:hypothetical protein
MKIILVLVLGLSSRASCAASSPYPSCPQPGLVGRADWEDCAVRGCCMVVPLPEDYEVPQ